MRFHTTAVIHGYDPAGVRRALLDRLKTLTIEIEISGGLIMLSGLGPGLVSMNKDDFAILTIENQSDAVSIEIDGVFDGNYLEDHAAQESEVCAKLGRIFDSVQNQIELEQMPGAGKPLATETKASPDMIPKPEFMSAAASTIWAAMRLSKHDLLADSDSVVTSVSAAHADVPKRSVTSLAPAGFRQFGFVAIAGLMVMAVGIVGIQRYLHTPKKSDSTVGNSGSGTHGTVKIADGVGSIAAAANLSPSVRAEGTSDNHATALPLAPKAAQLPAKSADPTSLLKHWEAAMRTRNAVEQSSYYADPVDRYEGVGHIDWATLKKKKQAAIESRRGLWTVKLERIEIERRTVDEAQVRLIQHVIDQPERSQISEQFVQTELRLRRVNGDWKIVSEENVAQSSDPPAPRS